MPYINLNGKLTQVTQEQYDIYTVGQNQGQTGTIQTPAQAAAAVAAGGTQLVNNSGTSPILTTSNTTNNTPGQTLTTTSASVVNADIQRLIDSGLYDPAPGFNFDGTPKTTESTVVLSTDTSNVAAQVDNVVRATNATPVSSAVDPAVSLSAGESIVNDATNTGTGTSAAASAAALNNIQGMVQNAQQQQTIANQRKQTNNGDWRVKLRLAPQSTYLYNASDPGILAPLSTQAGTDGIIFPYTPSISTAYRAQYSNYDLTHSNFRGYFYQNSYVDKINLTCTFTAQDTSEANYLLAVIHFFRSVTKMFYGQDAQRGSPPPVCFLSGFGDYQFKEHPVLVEQFNYTLPPDVDYIRAGSPNNVGLNLTSVRTRQNVATNTIFNQLNRLANAFLSPGAINQPPAPPTLGLNNPTYVPTKMEIQLTLLPIQSRDQVSNQFSVKGFANGNLLKGGFW